VPVLASPRDLPSDQPKLLLVDIRGLDKPFRTELSDAGYRQVRDLGEEYLRRNPRCLHAASCGQCLPGIVIISGLTGPGDVIICGRDR
jgi:hypothetical protein